jgi:4-hydroxy-2-oxoheptanedioate aldolase
VLVALASSADEARAVVDATRYPPEGSRSFGPLRGSRYTFDNDDYLDRANDNILVAMIVETRGALEELDEIAAVPGVDALTLGPYDMSLALGLDPRKLPHPEIDNVMERMLEAGRRHDVAIGSAAGSPERIAGLIESGVTFVNYGSDYSLLAGAAKAGLEAFRKT